jgi:hypothetical protein
LGLKLGLLALGLMVRVSGKGGGLDVGRRRRRRGIARYDMGIDKG